MNDLTMYRHSIYNHAETGEVAISAPPTPEVECECPDQDPWRAAVHYHPACPFTPRSAA